MYSLRLIPFDSEPYKELVNLRLTVLRQPLGLRFSPEALALEYQDLHVACYAENNLVGGCVLSPVDEELVRLRQMGVLPRFRGKGAGKAILEFAELQALEAGFGTVMMHARKTAVPFYQKAGYRITGDEFLEVGIPHLEMTKALI